MRPGTQTPGEIPGRLHRSRKRGEAVRRDETGRGERRRGR